MSIRIDGDTIYVEGAAPVADAEPILSALLDDPSRKIDLSGALRPHSAILQLLFALRPAITGVPADAFVAEWIFPLLDALEGQA